ncbi:heterokaryon incompatibility protein-domain-containing protein [Xylariaceae sp. FL1651]|nr:heterokaryon incompatibility protein-domain-containing protein [Xylariaceae sp. FL1651]
MHFGCNVATCEKAQYANQTGFASLKQYRRCATEGSCQTCLTVVNALLIPEIKSVWQESIAQALLGGHPSIPPELAEDEEAIVIAVETPPRWTGGWFLRTAASNYSLHWRHFDIWQDPAIARENNKCKAFLPRSCQPVQRTDSSQSFEHLRFWLRKCDETHSCYRKDNTELPTRLLKLTEGQVRVVDTEEGAKTRYLTLSHRWGANETFKLTKANVLSMKQNMPWISIPKVYQDAIRIARELQINYIWIDSLCIIQDDLGDWERESIRMRIVYRNSYLNIAACHARESGSDLFSTSNLTNRFPTYFVPGSMAKYIRQQPHWTHTDYGINYTDQNNQQVLLSRGWVLQERLLSPRIAYYDADELKWECNVTTDCQCGGMNTISNFKVDYIAALEGSRSQESLPKRWMKVVQRYSRLGLTYDTDRVVALAGIADQALKLGNGGRYLAGLWEDNLASQLCWWTDDTHRKVEKYLAPSWSWMSVSGAVNFYDARYIAVEIIEAECTTTSSQTGAITGGFLKINGKWIRLLASIFDLGSETKPPSYHLAHAEIGIKFSTLVKADYIMSVEQATAVQDVFVVFWGVVEGNRYAFVLLRQVSGDEERFERESQLTII